MPEGLATHSNGQALANLLTNIFSVQSDKKCHTRSLLPARLLSWHLQSSGETCQSQTCLAVTVEKEKYDIFWEVW